MTNYYSPRTPEIDPGGACSGVECAAAGAVDSLLLFVWLGAVGVVIAGLLFIPRARALCAEERRRTDEEARAFDRFGRRVSKLETTAGHGPGGAGRVPAAAGTVAAASASRPDDRNLRAIREAYRETVMSVDHYEEEYGETLAENLAAEFDDEVATAVADGGQLTPGLKRLVASCAFEARDRREELREVLASEMEALEATDDALSAVDDELDGLDRKPLLGLSYDELEDAYDRLSALEGDVESVIDDRQREIQTGGTVGGRFTDQWAMYGYLYRPLSTPHPVLSEGTALLERLSGARHRVLDSLTCRV